MIGRNNKGLVTYDRKLKKDAFYIYKAYWTTDPMVYVAGRRFADRAPEERNITVYTNCECLKIAKGWMMTMGDLSSASMLTTIRDHEW